MANFIISLVVLALLIVAAGFFIYYFYRKKNPKKSRQTDRDFATQGAVRLMRNFARSNGFKFIAPAQFEYKGENVKIDAVVVGYFGVLGVMALGYNGEIYGDAKDTQWTQITDDGKRRSFPNPLTESSMGVRVLREALFAKKLKKVPVEVMCVFTNKDAHLAVPRSISGLKMKDLRAQIAKEKYLEDTKLDIDAVESAISQGTVPKAQA